MKKISRRAFAVLLIAFMVLAGVGVFISREYENGGKWARYFSVYNTDSTGEIIDANGYELAYFNGPTSKYATDPITRESNYHVTGDYWGRTGTGLITRFYQESHAYDFVTGSTQSGDFLLRLTIDSQLNNKAYSLLKANGNGCIMICNYKTGEVLCMVSSPSLDPAAEINEEELEDGTYLNKCLSSVFTPGSTFKLITSAAAIENLPDLYEKKFICYGESEVAGVKITCTTAHYEQNFEEALANSCNCAFAEIAVELGQNTLAEYAKKYGFLDSGEIDGIKTAAGNFPTEFVGDPETAWAGIGQSTDQVNPYAMLRYVCAIANAGVVVEPDMVKDAEHAKTMLVEQSTANEMKRLMRNNVLTHYEGEVNFPNLELCAKTGTAEVGDGSSHSWFTGFLMDDAHPYAFVALVEKGGFGLWTAGLMMNELLQQMVNQ